MRQAGGEVRVGGRVHDGAAVVGLGERLGQRAKAPGSAEIQAVEMRDFAVAAVGRRRRDKYRLRQFLGKSWKKTVEPGSETIGRQQPAHAFRLDERGRKKIVAARLAPGRTARVRGVPAP